MKIHGEEIQVRATIRRMDDYSGHADGPELVRGSRRACRSRASIFLTHGEEDAQLRSRLKLANGVVAAGKIVRPSLDDVYDLDGDAARLIESETRPRIDPLQVAKPDWHNDLTKLVIDLNEEVKKAADEKSRAVILRRLRRALSGDAGRGGEANE